MFSWMERSDRVADLQAWLQAATAEGMARINGINSSNFGRVFGVGEFRLQDWFVPVLFQEKADPQLFRSLRGLIDSGRRRGQGAGVTLALQGQVELRHAGGPARGGWKKPRMRSRR